MSKQIDICKSRQCYQKTFRRISMAKWLKSKCFQIFKDQIVSRLQELFQSIGNEGQLPFLEANITLKSIPNKCTTKYYRLSLKDIKNKS